MLPPDTLDLNLLRVFARLHELRRVSKVADDLGLTQPAVSNALARLRKALGDPLFVATPQGMAPTPYASQLAPTVAQSLGAIGAALAPRRRFAPAASEREFRLGMSDIGEIYFLPTLVQGLAEAAPGVTLTTVRNTAVDLKEAMQSGQVDLAIGLLPQLRGGFHQRELFIQRYVCLFRAGHALAQRRLTRAVFERAEHLVVVSAGTGHHRVDEELRRQGIERRVRLTVPHFVAIGHILASTDLVATVPERLAQRLAGPFGLLWRSHPATLPQAPIRMFWHRRAHADEGHRWLRQWIAARYADADGLRQSAPA